MKTEEDQLRNQTQVWWDEESPEIIRDEFFPMISRVTWNQLNRDQKVAVMTAYSYGDNRAIEETERMMSRLTQTDWRIRNAKCPKCKSQYPVYHPEEGNWNCDHCNYTRRIRRMNR